MFSYVRSNFTIYRAFMAASVLCASVLFNPMTAAAQEGAVNFKAPPSAALAFDVQGKASGFNYSATAQLDWKNEGTKYQASQSVRMPLLGSRSQTSQGLIDAQGLQPVRFEDSRRNRVLQFDPAASTVIYNGQTTPTPVDADSQDRLSVFFQLASAVRAHPEQFTKGKQITIPTVSINKQDVWVFEVEEAAEPLKVAAGTLEAIKLKRLPRKENDQTAEIWLAPQNHYLPARILVAEDDGDWVDLTLNQFTASSQ